MASRDRLRGGAARLLLAWYSQGHRDLPWRRTSDPYSVWVSEIMLQQTRVQAAIPYYERFLERFPTVEALGAARESEALALWSGLGYYSRARNMLSAAKKIAAAGEFPKDYDGLRELPGVGEYTAAAIASIAYNQPYAVVDGNVLRVAARVLNDSADVGSARVRNRFRETVQGWLDRRRPGAFNQALMELGATVCLPKSPLCAECPLEPLCGARAAGTESQLPVKLKRAQPVLIESVALVVRERGRVLLRRETESARRMAGFWHLPAPEDLPGVRVGAALGTFRHVITRHCYTIRVHAAAPDQGLGRNRPAFRWFAERELASIPLSTTARKALALAGFGPERPVRPE